MSASRPPQPRVWDRQFATVPMLVADPDWPFAKTATYRMAHRGDIPTTRLGTSIVIDMAALRAQLHAEADQTTDQAAA